MKRVIIIALLFTSCAGILPYDTTPTENAVYTCVWVSTILDGVTTDKVLDQGGYEMNPLLTKHPNDEALITYGAVKLLAHSALGYFEWWRKWGWGISCVSTTVLTVHNYGEIE